MKSLFRTNEITASVCEEMHLECTDYFLSKVHILKIGKSDFQPNFFSLSNLNCLSSLPKVQEMLEMTNLCDGIILVGEAFSGKTTLYQVLLFYSNNTTRVASKINVCSRLWQKCLPSWGGRLTGRRTRCTGSS